MIYWNGGPLFDGMGSSSRRGTLAYSVAPTDPRLDIPNPGPAFLTHFAVFVELNTHAAPGNFRLLVNGAALQTITVPGLFTGFTIPIVVPTWPIAAGDQVAFQADVDPDAGVGTLSIYDVVVSRRISAAIAPNVYNLQYTNRLTPVFAGSAFNSKDLEAGAPRHYLINTPGFIANVRFRVKPGSNTGTFNTTCRLIINAIPVASVIYPAGTDGDQTVAGPFPVAPGDLVNFDWLTDAGAGNIPAGDLKMAAHLALT